MYRLCISRKHPYPQSLGRLMEIPSGRRGFKTKRFKRKYVAKPEFSGGWMFKLRNLPWEGCGYFLEQHISLNFPSSVGLEFSTSNIHTT